MDDSPFRRGARDCGGGPASGAAATRARVPAVVRERKRTAANRVVTPRWRNRDSRLSDADGAARRVRPADRDAGTCPRLTESGTDRPGGIRRNSGAIALTRLARTFPALRGCITTRKRG